MTPDEFISALNKKTEEKKVWTFTNILAMTVVLGCLFFLFTAPYLMSKFESKDNTMLSQIVTSISNVVMVIIAFYFGSSMGQAKQQQQITDMHKAATELAFSNSAASEKSVENKVDIAEKIGELRIALEGLEPESDDAKKILEQIKELEKQS